jgi:hypothetical protein
VRALAITGLLAAACAHPQPPMVLGDHVPYTGAPLWVRCPAAQVVWQQACPRGGLARPDAATQLTAARAQGSDVIVQSGEIRTAQPPLTQMQRLDKLRAALAAIDAHVAGLGDHPSPEERQVLKLTATEVRKLLETWPDVIPEADEMLLLIDKLETTLPLEQPQVRKRITQLTDLIRLQVVVGD